MIVRILLARRVLKTLEMDAEYDGNVEATGEDFSVEPAESRRPFRALLDASLIRTTTGNRVFGALKGALDGGLVIPHSDKRFADFSKDKKQLDAEVHCKYIYGGHVAAFCKELFDAEGASSVWIHGCISFGSISCYSPLKKAAQLLLSVSQGLRAIGFNSIASLILAVVINMHLVILLYLGGFLLHSFPYTFTTFTRQSTVLILHMTRRRGKPTLISINGCWAPETSVRNKFT